MSCEGPFFKVKHFPGSVAQPLDAAWVRGQDRHGQAVVHVDSQNTPSSLCPPIPQKTCPSRQLVDTELGWTRPGELGIPAQCNLQMCGS